MKINIIKTFSIAILAGALVAPIFAFAQVPPTGGDNTGGASAGVPATAGDSTGGANANVPNTAGGNTGGANPGVPATSGDGIGGASQIVVSNTIPPTGGSGIGGGGTAQNVPATGGSGIGGANTGTTPPAVVTPPTSGPSGGGPNIGFGGGRGYSSGGSAILPLLTNVSQCNYISSYLKIGKANPADQVTRLQTFLKNTEGLKVDMTGVFDQKTFDAVSAFQLKYTTDVLAPWGTKESTGQVYYTTQKKINEIYCKASFALTPAQLAEITAYRTSQKNAPIKSVSIKSDAKTETTKNISSPTSTPATVHMTNTNGTSTDNDQTASAVKTSSARKVWNFIKGIFGR